MGNDLVYYDTGDKIFRAGEQVFINKAYEHAETHLHAHDFIEIAYVVSGSGVHRIGESEYSVSKGDLFIINYDTPHEFRSLHASSETSLYVYNCIFKPEFIDSSLINCKDFSDITYHFFFKSFFPEESKDRNGIKLIDFDSHEIEELYEKMYREYQAQEEGYVEIIRAYIIELLITIFRLYRRNVKLEKENEVRHKQIIEKVLLYLKGNHSREIKLENLPFTAFLSRNYFCKLFKEYTGMTTMEYVQKVRIEEACMLLKETDLKVIDIASEVGYSDVKFFNQIFKKSLGRTPREYRKR
jgi:AraC family transcriptional regulator, L-rhamnose operon transcriptional activator RhaR